MEVKDNKVYISGDLSLDYVENPASVNNVWLYYFDTLITGTQVHEIPVEQRMPPYKTGRYTYFATFDLNGNLLDNHFVTALDREISISGVRGEFGLCSPGIGWAPFHIDSEGNIHVLTRLQYAGFESDPYTIIVDGDTNKTYDVYLPGNADPYGASLENIMMYKFSPDWELLYAKPMVVHTEGIATSWELAGDSVNPQYNLHIYGMYVDDNDNMYVSGNMELALFANIGGDLHQYPIHIYWDSTHYASIQDITSANPMGFFVKYDTNGIVQWSNQIYTRGESRNSAMASVGGICVYDGDFFILGQGGYSTEENGLVYFDDESNPLQRYQQSTLNQTFIVRYDAQTGNYLGHGVVPALNALAGVAPTIVNNRVFAYANILSSRKIYQWTKEGMFIQTIDFSVSNSAKYPEVLVTHQGNLLFSLGTIGSVLFPNGLTANCPSGQSSAVFALYHDPSFAQPFVPDDSVGIEDFLDRRESDIYISPNPTSGPTFVHGYMYGYQSIELYDLQGRKLADLVEAWHPSAAQTMQPIPAFDLTPYPAGTYLVKINFNRGVSVTRKVVKR